MASQFVMDVAPSTFHAPSSAMVFRADDPEDQSAVLTNQYTTSHFCAAVTKQWTVNGKVIVPEDSTTLNVKLQRTADEKNWTDVTGIYLGDTVVGNTAGRAGNEGTHRGSERQPRRPCVLRP